MPDPGHPIRAVRWAGPQDATAVVEATGDIDLNHSPAFQSGLAEVLHRQPSGIIVDLSAVAYMDSSGVASLVKLLARSRQAKATLRLAGMNDRVRSIFETTRLDRVFDIFATAEEALRT